MLPVRTIILPFFLFVNIQVDLVARLQLLGIMIDQSGIPKIESGYRPVSDVEVVALAKALNISVAWLFGEIEA